MGSYKYDFPEYLMANESPYTWEQIGEEIGVSTQRAQQICIEALRKLQKNERLKELFLASLDKESDGGRFTDTSYRYSTDAYLGD